MKNQRDKRRDNKRVEYKKRNISKGSLDYVLLISILALGLFGLMALYSASSYLTIKNDVGNFYYLIRQGIFFVSGLFIMILTSRINYKFFYNKSKVIYIIAIILLVMIYVSPFAVTQKGATRSLRLGITFMPSDVAKPAIIIALAYYLSRNQKLMYKLKEGLIYPALIIGIPFVLVLAQTDLSTSLVILFSSGLVFLVGGFKKKFLPLVIILGVIAILIFWNFILQDYQLNRILAFLNPSAYYNDLSWQVLNGLFAVSRGGLLGQGYGRSVYKHGYLANEVNNDMIFSVIAEEFGFIRTFIFILLVFFITFRMIKIAMKSKDEYSKLLVLGIALVYLIQSIINIGVSIALIPNTGITLPFVSQGGTSLWAFSFMFGLVLNISRYIKQDEKKKKLKKVDQKLEN